MNLICVAFDGETITEKRGFQSANDAWEHAANMGSRWFFYPFAFVTTSTGKTIKDAPEGMRNMVGHRVSTIRRVFAQLAADPTMRDADPEEFSLAAGLVDF